MGVCMRIGGCIRRLVFSVQTGIITNLGPACGGFSLFTAPFLLLCFDELVRQSRSLRVRQCTMSGVSRVYNI